MEHGQREENQDGVGEPRVQSDEVKALGHMVRVEKLKDVEVEEVETIATFANEEEGSPGEDGGDGVRATEAENKSGKDGGQEAAVHEEVGGMADEGIEEESDSGEADGGEVEALTRGERESVLQFSQGDASEEGANVGERGVLEETDESGGTVAVNGADYVVGVEVEVERVGDEANDPETDQEEDQVEGSSGPGQADEPGEGGVEDTFAGEGPGDCVPEGGDRRAPTLKDERSEDDSLPELGVRAGVPLVLHHAEGDDEYEQIDGIETGEAGEPELTLDQGTGTIGVVVGEDVAGDEEEDADEDVAVVDERIENAEVRRCEMKENDGDGE
jgi:hypothetical protein